MCIRDRVEAVETIKDMPYSAIFHEQGLGKTKIAIDLLLYWLKCKDLDTVMIVTKKQLVKNWVDEFAIHTHIKLSLIHISYTIAIIFSHDPSGSSFANSLYI